MLHIYYGMGKGKSSTLNGSAIRAKGAGMEVVLFRFLKGRPTSEDEVLKKAGIEVYTSQSNHKFVMQMDKREKSITKKELVTSIKKLKKIYNDFDLILLDEFLDLIVDNVDLLKEEELLDILLELKESGKEIMISGHNKNKAIFEIADLISYYNPEKHYYDQGVKARKGIEF